MFNILLSDRRVRTVLKGDREQAINEIELGDANNVFVSADLTAASDRIIHDHAIALWSGLFKKMSELEKDILYMALGP